MQLCRSCSLDKFAEVALSLDFIPGLGKPNTSYFLPFSGTNIAPPFGVVQLPKHLFKMLILSFSRDSLWLTVHTGKITMLNSKKLGMLLQEMALSRLPAELQYVTLPPVLRKGSLEES